MTRHTPIPAARSPEGVGRSPDGSGSRPSDRAAEGVSPVPASIPNADFTLADVLAWARTKPAGEAYDYCSNGNCALAQFLRETGRASEPSVDPFTWEGDGSGPREYDERIDYAANGRREKQTFGEFVSRLELMQ